MGTAVRSNRRVLLAAAAAAALLVWAGALEAAVEGDFKSESWPAYALLQGGDVDGFLAHVPGYSTFVLIVGAPAALVADLLGGSEKATLRAVSLLPAFALAGLAAVLAGQARATGNRWWPLIMFLACGPIALKAITYGHPEELLATAGAVGAVLAAVRGRVGVAGVLLVIAIAAKQWAVLAVAPVLLAAPRAHLRIAAAAALGTAAVLLVSHFTAPVATSTLVSTGGILHAQSLWWPLAPGPSVNEYGSQALAPAWFGISHPLIVALSVPICLAWWLRGSSRVREDALLLLALLFLERCLLDPWNNVYYQLPLIVALLAWEVQRGERRPPLTMAVTLATWLSFAFFTRVGWAPFLVYAAWSIPLAWHLSVRLYGDRRSSARWRPVPVASTVATR
jgi:hypothetical protein